MIARDVALSSIDSRLAEAAARGEKVEVILVLRGRLSRASGSGRWRIRVDGQRVLTFRADAVVAVTRAGRG
jgi:hypothetical protein